MKNDDLQPARDALARVLKYAKVRDYAGYSKFDGLESPVSRAMTLGTRFGRLLIQQAVKYSVPFNIRPFLLIRKERNPKGIALFARAMLVAGAASNEPTLREEGRALLDWLIDNNSRHFRGQDKPYSGLCWGYNFHWQSPGYEAPRLMPNVIVTSFVAEALLTGYEALGEQRYLDAARSAVDFMMRDLPALVDENECYCVGYVPVEKPFVVVNVNAVSGALMAKIARHTDESELIERARRQLNFVELTKTEYGAWFYTHPPGDSPIRHDNYHTGGVLDGILDYTEATGDQRFKESFEVGLAYYRKHLFEDDGAPRWMNDARYPYDVHGAAQGIITFSKVGDLEMAGRILGWAEENLHRSDGAYRYQLGRYPWTTRSYTLMRWCNGWMSWALACFLEGRQRRAAKWV